MTRMSMTIKNANEIERMRAAGLVVALVHARIQEALQPGITTQELDDIARETLKANGAVSSFLGYHSFPRHICTSVNDEIVHGIPGGRRLHEGDIVSVDVGAIVDGYHGDSAWTYGVGTISDEASRLLAATEGALEAAVRAALPGKRLGAIGRAVEDFAGERGFGLVREYGGHGIGRQMHEDPHVPNHGNAERGVLLRSGLTLAIEPMLNAGSDETRVREDGWTVVTADGSLSAHFEHTVAIADGEADILTRRVVPVVQ